MRKTGLPKTKVKTKKSRLLLLTIALLFGAMIVIALKPTDEQGQGINNQAQIEAIQFAEDGKILVTLNLPFYRSVSGYSEYPDASDQTIMNVAIESHVDFLMSHNETIELQPYTYTELSQINFLNNIGEVIKTYPVE